MKILQAIGFWALGTLFAWTLSRSGATDYNYIQAMFLLTEFQLYGIIGSAVAVAAPGLYLLKRYGKTLTGAPVHIKQRPVHKGNIVGGILFGLGWSITGMCPGPILVNIGEGKLYALAAFAGTLLGTWLLGRQYPRLQKPLGLPPIED